MSADAISSEQEKQGAEANLQKISSPSADHTLDNALHTEAQNKEAKVAPSAAEATKEKADTKGNKNLQSKKNLEKVNAASRTSGAAAASNGSISRKHDSATKARSSDRAQNTQKKNNLSASLRDQRPAASPRSNPATSTQALQSDRQNIKEPASSMQQALRNQSKKSSVPSDTERSTVTDKENRAERKTNLKWEILFQLKWKHKKSFPPKFICLIFSSFSALLGLGSWRKIWSFLLSVLSSLFLIFFLACFYQDEAPITREKDFTNPSGFTCGVPEPLIDLWKRKK